MLGKKAGEQSFRREEVKGMKVTKTREVPLLYKARQGGRSLGGRQDVCCRETHEAGSVDTMLS